MRKAAFISICSLLLLVLLAAPASAAVRATVSITAFHDALAPHGRWIATRSYGDVWVPAGIEPGWQPYWNGEWVWSEYGWTWVSDDPWGDVPFHYGTWVWMDGYGWVWIPGTVWAPAWVTWAWTDDCVGWAPVPAAFVLGASGYSGRPIVLAASRYVFVPTRRFVGVRVSDARLPAARNPALLSRARTATRFSISRGIVRATADPPPSLIQRATGRRLQRVGVERIRTRPTNVVRAAHGGRIGVVMPARQHAAAAHRAGPRGRTAASAVPATTAGSPSPGLPASPGAHAARTRPEIARRDAQPRPRAAVEPQHSRAPEAITHRAVLAAKPRPVRKGHIEKTLQRSGSGPFGSSEPAKASAAGPSKIPGSAAAPHTVRPVKPPPHPAAGPARPVPRPEVRAPGRPAPAGPSAARKAPLPPREERRKPRDREGP